MLLDNMMLCENSTHYKLYKKKTHRSISL